MRVAKFGATQSFGNAKWLPFRTKSMIPLVTVFVLAASAVASSSSDAQNPTASIKEAALEAHNIERDEFGSPPLQWSEKLAAEAQIWAGTLASEGRMRHASNDERVGAGENLWMGPSGVFSAHVIVGTFIAEKRHFAPGVFPNITSTGKWRDVGHYSQVVWPETQELGCAVGRNDTNEFWVCRYWPAGNKYGVDLKPAQQTE